MTQSRTTLRATMLFAVGSCALVGGTALAVVMATELLRMGVGTLWALLSWVPFLSEPNRHPVPEYDLFLPSLTMLVGLFVVLVGWVVVIRAAALAWPSRFDRSRGDAS